MQEALSMHSQKFNFLCNVDNFNIIYNVDGRQMPGMEYCNDLFDEQRVHFPDKMS